MYFWVNPFKVYDPPAMDKHISTWCLTRHSNLASELSMWILAALAGTESNFNDHGETCSSIVTQTVVDPKRSHLLDAL